MIGKNTFAVFGILAVLLTSLGMVSATDCLSLALINYPSEVTAGESFVVQFNLTQRSGCSSNRENLSWTITPIKSTVVSTSFLPISISTGETKEISLTFNINPSEAGDVEVTIYVIDDEKGDNDTLTTPLITINPTSQLTITSITDLTKTTNGTIKIQNTGNVDLDNIELKQTLADFTIQFNETTPFGLTAGQSKLVEISSTDADSLDFRDDNSLSIKAVSGSTESDALTITIPASFYSGENEGEIEIEIEKVDVKEGFGDDEGYWYPFDEIELEINIDNKGQWDIEDMELKLCLLDVERNRCIFDEDDMNIEKDKFDLDGGDDKDILVNFEVNPSDLKEGNTKYVLYISAIGEIDDSESNYDGDETGSSVLKEIEIVTNDDFVILDEIILMDLSNYQEDETSCGNEVKVTAKVWNVGDNDLDNDEIFVLIYNKQLGINKVVSFNQGINSMDWELLETTFVIPSDAKEKSYSIEFTVYDDEHLADKDIYENKEDDKAIFCRFIKVANCESSVVEPTISANLESEAEVGEELIVKALITNNAEDGNFIISLSGFEDWATLVSVNPQTTLIKEGEFAEVIITLKPTTDGQHSFTINIVADGESYSQPVSVNITEGKSGIFSEIGNTTLYIIAGIAVLLIIIVLIIIVKISRKQTKPQF